MTSPPRSTELTHPRTVHSNQAIVDVRLRPTPMLPPGEQLRLNERQRPTCVDFTRTTIGKHGVVHKTESTY